MGELSIESSLTRLFFLEAEEGVVFMTYQSSNHNSSTITELSFDEIENVSGGPLPILACVVIAGLGYPSCI